MAMAEFHAASSMEEEADKEEEEEEEDVALAASSATAETSPTQAATTTDTGFQSSPVSSAASPPLRWRQALGRSKAELGTALRPRLKCSIFAAVRIQSGCDTFTNRGAKSSKETRSSS